MAAQSKAHPKLAEVAGTMTETDRSPPSEFAPRKGVIGSDRGEPECRPRDCPTGGAETAIACPMNFSKAAMRGSMAASSEKRLASASVVLRPLPVMQSTVSSSGRMRPWAMRDLAQATVTPAAVSPKIPSVEASSSMPETRSSSDTSAAQPPLARIMRLA